MLQKLNCTQLLMPVSFDYPIFFSIRFIFNTIVVSLLLLTFYSCNKTENPLFQKVNSQESGIDFINSFAENDTFNLLQNEYIYNGAGVAVGDLNNDGLPELFFTGNQVRSALYLNQGTLHFKDVTDSAHVSTTRWATGVTFADVNADGWLDIYVSCAGDPKPEKRRSYLFINQHNLTFTEEAIPYGLADTGYNTQATFLDFDRDGDLDMYLLNHANKDRDPNYIKPQARDGSGASTDKLFRNNGNSTFTDVSQQAGILVEGYGLGMVVTDVNKDGWQDIYIANDYVYNDILYINQQNGTFRDELKTYMTHTSQFAMGTDAGDINNDGYPDIITVDMLPPDNLREKTLTGPMGYDRFQHTLSQGYLPQYMRNTLQVNNAGNSFTELGQLANVHATDWSWAPLLADFDGDGYNDLFYQQRLLQKYNRSGFYFIHRRAYDRGYQQKEKL
jgi:enediyne biosynthesis protein E4